MEGIKAFLKNLLSNKPALFWLGVLGVLFSLPNPIIALPPLIFIAFAPLFIINTGKSFWHRLFFGFLFLFVISLGVIFPLDINKLILSLPSVGLLLCAFAIADLLYAFGLASGGINPFLLAAGWVAAQYLSAHCPLTFPLPIEVALVRLPALLQSASVFGPYSGAFLIISVNAAIANLILRKKHAQIYTFVLILFVINFGYGLVVLNEKTPVTPMANLAIMQPNTTLREGLLTIRSSFFREYFDGKKIWLSREAVKKGAQIVVWPEAEGDNYILQDDKFLSRLHQEVGAEMVIGTSYIDYVRYKKFYNIAFLLKADGSTTPPYRKIGLFPFAEGAFYTPGSDYLTLPSHTLNSIGAMICLDSAYPWLARNLVRNGANILVALSTDTLFGNSIMPYFHENLIALRAIENGRFGIHVGNNGPSAAFDNKGQLLFETPYNKTAYANINVSPLTGTTIYNRLGDWFAVLCTIVTIVNMLLAFKRKLSIDGHA